jgi:hypothetical protein
MIQKNLMLISNSLKLFKKSWEKVPNEKMTEKWSS